jgi:PAS domain S-box-containing protein
MQKFDFNQTDESIDLYYLQRMGRIGWWELDIKTGKTRWSSEIFEIYGLPTDTDTDKALGMSFYAPEDTARLGEMIDACADQGVSQTQDFRFIDAAGQQKWVRVFMEAIYGEDGKVSRICGTQQDITELQAARERELAQETRLAAYENGLNEYAILSQTDGRGVITDVNDKFCEISGYSREELVGQDHRVINSGYHAQEYMHNLWQTIKSGRVWRGEIRNKTKQGAYYWVDTTITPVFSQTGSIKGFISFRYDVSHRRRVDQTARAIGELRQDYIDTDSLSSLSASLLSGGLRLLNACRGEICVEYQDEELQIQRQNPVELVASSGQSLEQTRFPLMHRGQELGWVKYWHRPGALPGEAVHDFKGFFENASALVVRWIAVNTARRNLEQERKINEHQARLASIGELGTGVAHEINNPLSILQGHIDLVRMALEDAPNERAFESLNKMEEASERIARITKTLTSFARKGSDTTDFDPARVLLDTVNFVRAIYKTDRIEITTNIDVCPGVVRGSSHLYQQAILNLLSNARDAMAGQDAERLIAVTLETDQRNLEVCLKISDTGPGVPDDIAETVFEPYFTTKKLGKGTGMGLAMVKQTFADLGGDVILECHDCGAEFICRFKYAEKAIVVVDDDKEVTKLVAYLAKSLGYVCIEVNHPEEVVEAIQGSEKFVNLVITDLNMPRLDGTDVLAEIRQLPEPPRVVLMTGTTVDEDLKAQFDGFLQKPFHSDNVISLLKYA